MPSNHDMESEIRKLGHADAPQDLSREILRALEKEKPFQEESSALLRLLLPWFSSAAAALLIFMLVKGQQNTGDKSAKNPPSAVYSQSQLHAMAFCRFLGVEEGGAKLQWMEGEHRKTATLEKGGVWQGLQVFEISQTHLTLKRPDGGVLFLSISKNQNS